LTFAKHYANLVIAGVVVAAVLSLGGYIVHLKSVANSANDRAAKAEARTEQHKNAATAWEVDGLQARLDLGQCQSQWAEAKVSAADMIADAKARVEKAEANARAWKARWDERSSVCSVALNALNDACPELGDF
jgi:hypothetical protein